MIHCRTEKCRDYVQTLHKREKELSLSNFFARLRHRTILIFSRLSYQLKRNLCVIVFKFLLWVSLRLNFIEGITEGKVPQG
jgi:hypothetical protein